MSVTFRVGRGFWYHKDGVVGFSRFFSLLGCLLLLTGCRSPDATPPAWQGLYYLQGEAGCAVEFQGPRYGVRTHTGCAIKEGRWREQAGARVVAACCQEFTFRLGVGLVDSTGGVWVRSAPPCPLRNLPHAPVQIKILDIDTGLPVTCYRYRHAVAAPQGHGYPAYVMMRTVEAADGVVTLELPVSCQLGLEIDAMDYFCQGSGYGKYEIDIASTLSNRVVTLELQRGLTVDGVLLDMATGEPIVGASVMPLIDSHPIMHGNRDREVVTDHAGRFRVHAVNAWAGIEVDDRIYGVTRHTKVDEWDRVDGAPYERQVALLLERAPRVAGTVQSSAGEPLAGVNIESYNGRQTRTDGQGRFELYGATGRLVFRHPTHIEEDRELSDATEAMTVQLQEKHRLHGTVVTGDGDPVTHFVIVTRNGDVCADYNELEVTVRDPQGRFDLSTAGPITNLVAVQAEGFALTHVPVVLTRPPAPLTVVLHRGGTVSGRVALPDAYDGAVSVSLRPQRDGGLWRIRGGTSGWSDYLSWKFDVSGGEHAIRLGTRRGIVDQTGRYRIAHVGPGSYTLSVTGDGLREQRWTVRIPAGDRTLPLVALEAAPSGKGAVGGLVCRPWVESPHGNYEPWPFANGNLIVGHHGETVRMPFKADEAGRYHVTNVPAGSVLATAEYDVTLDIIDSLTATGMVTAGSTVVMDLLPDLESRSLPFQDAELTLDMQIGDGSEADFWQGLGDASRRFSLALEGSDSGQMYDLSVGGLNFTNQRFSMSGLTDTSVKVSLRDRPDGFWSDATVWELPHDIVLAGGTNRTVEVLLPPHSLRGHLGGVDGGGAADVCLVRDGKVVRRSAVSSDQAFLIPFVDPAEYTLWIHDRHAGWLVQPDVLVDGVCDAGLCELKTGTEVVLSVRGDWIPLHESVDFHIELTHRETGISLSQAPDTDRNGGTAAFHHLWPGIWTVDLFNNRKRCLSSVFSVKGERMMHVNLEWSDAPPVGDE